MTTQSLKNEKFQFLYICSLASNIQFIKKQNGIKTVVPSPYIAPCTTDKAAPEQLKTPLNKFHCPSSSAYGDSGSSSDAVSRFFGITGTTSQDIQLGLTFTVPFLSVPLQSLQSMLGGGGLGDLFDNFSLDSSSVITIVVIGVAAIFVLPQIIYWLTGVNLSAFNWGRSNYLFFLSQLKLQRDFQFSIFTSTIILQTKSQEIKSIP